MFLNSPNHIHASFEICLNAHYHCNAVGKIYIIYMFIRAVNINALTHAI